VNDYYEGYWDNKNLDHTPHVVWKKTVLSKLNFLTERDSEVETRYLDIGCGNGFISEQFVHKYKVYGIDISHNALSEAEKKGIITQRVDKDELPFEDGFFDVVVCLDVLEHLLNPESMTKEVYRVLNKNGKFIVCVPNVLNIFNRIHFMCGEFVDVMDVAHQTGELFSEHVKMFSKNKLRLLLENNNFKIIQSFNYFPNKLSEKPRYQAICNMMNRLKIHDRLPSLFALGFLLVCEK